MHTVVIKTLKRSDALGGSVTTETDSCATENKPERETYTCRGCQAHTRGYCCNNCNQRYENIFTATTTKHIN